MSRGIRNLPCLGLQDQVGHPPLAAPERVPRTSPSSARRSCNRLSIFAKLLRNSATDTTLLIPTAHEQKPRLAEEVVMTTREAGVPNAVPLSLADCDPTEEGEQ
ncbi:hypothetical protein WOLCODRAFT_149999 [Wolfiporia cocos MD-104 SS10]|uniref:Uncharacterized protein n=1 Tax=Wolfiporia cocos (strain MD-104) TaxID=742152 RepID=A0A2H3JUX9_WOLCO|nr:hypothetical protein WOLCODRAFT_149999 [Wolfiporia cocos MD-104 SS10]